MKMRQNQQFGPASLIFSIIRKLGFDKAQRRRLLSFVLSLPVLADLPALGLAVARTTRLSRTKTLDARSCLIFLLLMQI